MIIVYKALRTMMEMMKEMKKMMMVVAGEDNGDDE